MIPKLPRVVRLMVPPMVGDDVYAHARAMHRTLKDGQLENLENQRPIVRSTFGTGKRDLARKVSAALEIAPGGVVDTELYVAMWDAGAYDLYAKALLRGYAHAHSVPALVYPLPLGSFSSICQGLHPTAGLLGNWAIDFCTVAGTNILAVERGWITRFSGHDPSDDVADSQGVFGWTTYYRTPAGYEYFVTHQGSRAKGLRVGQEVTPGTVIGKVGDQRHRPDHLHLGVTSPLGVTDAKRRITAVSRSPKVGAL